MLIQAIIPSKQGCWYALHALLQSLVATNCVNLQGKRMSQCDEDTTSIMFIVPNDHDRIKGLYRR